MIQFTVLGEPQSGGSKISGRTNFGRTYLRDTNPKVAEWKRTVKLTARGVMKGSPPLEGPLRLRVTFVCTRPKSHLTASGKLRVGAPEMPTVKPDLTKLLRPLEDALTGELWLDDSQVVETTMAKLYGDPACAEIEVRHLVQREAASELAPRSSKRVDLSWFEHGGPSGS